MSNLRDEIGDIIVDLSQGAPLTALPGSTIYRQQVEVTLPTDEMADRILALIADALTSEDVFGAMRWAATIEGAVTREGAFGVHVDHQRLVKAALEAAGVVKGQGNE